MENSKEWTIVKCVSVFQGMDHCKMCWCSQCLEAGYVSQEKLNEHLKLCLNDEAVKTKLPEKNKLNFNGDREDI